MNSVPSLPGRPSGRSMPLLWIWPAIIAVLAYGILRADELPIFAAVHFTWDGRPNGYAARTVLIYGLPAVMALLGGLASIFSPRSLWVGRLATVFILFLAFIQWGLIQANLDAQDGATITRFLGEGIAGLMIGLGWLLPEATPNPWFGIRTKYTRRSAENWKATHRFGGQLMVSVGLLLFGFEHWRPSLVVPLEALALSALVPALYSYRYSLQHEQKPQ